MLTDTALSWANGTLTMPQIDVLAVAAFLTACGVIFLAIRGANRFFKRANVFFDDWYGADGDDNHPPTPGVLHRMTSMETALNDHIAEENAELRAIGAEVSTIKSDVSETKKFVNHELGRNSGSTTKDAAHEALRVVREVQVQQEAEIIARRQDREDVRGEQLAHDQRLMTFFALVRRMITLPPDEQIVLWDDAAEKFAESTGLEQDNDDKEKS